MPDLWIRGEGGGIVGLDLPLPESIEQRMERGSIVRVNEDGSPYVPPAGATAEDEPDDPDTPLERPANDALKADWVAFAVQSGLDAAEAEALTKTQLVMRYGGS